MKVINSEDKIYSIYVLKEPNSDIVRYVGYSKNVKLRYKGHLKEKGSTRKNNWISNLKKLGLLPDIEEIECDLTIDEAIKKEIFYIKLYKSFGADLTNLTLGGDGVTMTPEIRAKISKANKGRVPAKHTIEASIKCRKGKPSWNKGKPMPDHVKEKLLRSIIGVPSWNKGKTFSDESKLKMSKSHLGREAWNKGTVGLMNAWNKGLKGVCKGFTGSHTDEAKLKMRQVKLGKKMSEDSKNKISISMKEYRKNNPMIMTDEQKSKIKSKFKKGMIPHNKGVPCSQEIKDKISNTKKINFLKKNQQKEINFET